MALKIMIAEDEPAQAEILQYNLDKEGYDCQIARDGEEALTRLEESVPDLLVLDWMLPKVSGIEVCRRLRRQKTTKNLPILMLTARGEEDDKIRGLEVGADDYVVKPFSPRELVARIQSLLRRTNPEAVAEVLEYAGISMDLEKYKVTRGGKTMKLGPTEFRILKVFMERPGRVLTRDKILDLAWGPNIYLEDRTIDVHIRRLRQVLNAGNQPDLIRTVRGVGYALDEDNGA